MISLKLDLHLHTIYSGDSLIKPDDLIKQAKKRGLDGFAITDHDDLSAYKILKKKALKKDLIVIPGMEIETHIGEVIGLFLREEIDVMDNHFFTIIKKIKDQQGIVLIPHPFDFLRDNHLKMNLLTDSIIEKYIDGIEIVNSRIIFPFCVNKAKKFNERYGLFETGGSDAHTIKEIGNSYTLIRNLPDTSLKSIKEALLSNRSKSMGKLSSPLVHVITVMNKLKKRKYF